MLKVSQHDIVNKASELMRMYPDITQDEALERAIAELTGYTVVRQKPAGIAKLNYKAKRPEESKRKACGPPPEHVLRNIQRVKQAEALRKQTGGILPTASFVSGGKVSPK